MLLNPHHQPSHHDQGLPDWRWQHYGTGAHHHENCITAHFCMSPPTLAPPLPALTSPRCFTCTFQMETVKPKYKADSRTSVDKRTSSITWYAPSADPLGVRCVVYGRGWPLITNSEARTLVSVQGSWRVGFEISTLIPEGQILKDAPYSTAKGKQNRERGMRWKLWLRW